MTVGVTLHITTLTMVSCHRHSHLIKPGFVECQGHVNRQSCLDSSGQACECADSVIHKVWFTGEDGLTRSPVLQGDYEG